MLFVNRNGAWLNPAARPSAEGLDTLRSVLFRVEYMQDGCGWAAGYEAKQDDTLDVLTDVLTEIFINMK